MSSNFPNDTLNVQPEEITHKVMTDVPLVSVIETFNDELNIGGRPRVEVDELKRIIDDFYLNQKNIEVKPLNYEMNIRLTSDVPFHCVVCRILRKTKYKNILEDYWTRR